MISVTCAEKSEQKNSIDTLKSCFFLQLNSVAWLSGRETLS